MQGLFDMERHRRVLGIGADDRPRWPQHGADQRNLLLATVAIGLGSVLPWVETAVGHFNGLAGAGVWTLYLAVLGVCGATRRRRLLVVAHGAVVATGTLALAGWQLLRLADVCGGGGCAPSTGLAMVTMSGVAAAWCTVRLVREAPRGHAVER